MTNTRMSAAAVRPLRTLDPTAPLDDLDWLDAAIGDARVVAIGESAHYNTESYQLRHRLLRYLVERHGFGAYAMESGFTEGWRADAWVHGAPDRLGGVMGDGMTSLMLLWEPMRAQLEWMRTRSVGYYGIDLGGSNVSLLPGLDAVTAYLADADPEFTVDPHLRDTAAIFAPPSAFSAPSAVAAYADLTPDTRDALTAGLATLAAHLIGRRLDYQRRTTVDAYNRALRSLRLVLTLDSVIRAIARGDLRTAMLNRDAAMADTVEWILRREGRVVLGAHNGHIQRWPCPLPGMAPMTPMGMHLAERLGEDYRVIGTTTGTGQTLTTSPDFYRGKIFSDLGPPQPGSLDALMEACYDSPFATDLRTLPPTDVATVAAATCQRHGTHYADLDPLAAYDVIVHLPRVTGAEPDKDALAHSPDEVRQAFSRWAG
ncbi:erythromycin esterase family protein [Actinokineospora auranticolor]|uniref:Erythromycin esterase n=1 Tax=Actinokineospora auranticolor TaxID=155976 RepID=A0A2S6GQT9_9PSEU|nr:erythromycin esterase family protein [Actinokineospora auranticolor]PPK67602.1 erythromycin esterase [Actinokineospora auranticolor]